MIGSGYFSLDNVAKLDSIPKGGKIHVIGVAGVAMAQLAVELQKQGYVITGSDKEFYEPMGSFLKKNQIKLFEGYKESNVPEDVDLVVIGNAVSYGHPEVTVVEKKRLPYTLFPKVIYEAIIEGTHSIVISGTHGKSTTTSLAATSLEKLGASPGYFIGAQVMELPTSLHRGSGKYTVLEGDEYDSAFFAKTSKFHFYKPKSLVITSIEYDHADIYPDLNAIIAEFSKLIYSMNKSSTVYACIDNATVRGMTEEWKKNCKAKILTYGISEDADIRLRSRRLINGMQELNIESSVVSSGVVHIPLSGEYNGLNATAVYGIFVNEGYSPEDIDKAFRSFQGLKRRQEILIDTTALTLIEDFAHHPTAVRETLKGIRERYGARRIWALFEPRSNTSRRQIFKEDYKKAFENADRTILSEVKAREIDSGLNLLDVKDLGREMKNTEVLPNSDAICELLKKEVKKEDVIIIMSNGSFDGLAGKLKNLLQ